MAKATVKVSEVDARQYAGTGTFTVMNDLRGELHAKKGDWLVGTEKGKIDVLTQEEFAAKYDLAEDWNEKDQEPNPIKNSPLVDPVEGAKPHHGILEPDGGRVGLQTPASGIVDQSQMPMHDSNTISKVSTPSDPKPAVAQPGDSNMLTVPSDSDVQLQDGQRVKAHYIQAGSFLFNGREVEHIDTQDANTIFHFKLLVDPLRK